MYKNSLFSEKSVFSQVLCLIPHQAVSRLSDKYAADRYCKKFKTYDHLVTMLYCCLRHCNSLREVILGMQAIPSQLLQVGLSFTPRRSTLCDANGRRSADLFEELYHLIYHRYYGRLPQSLKAKRLTDKLFIVD